MSFGCRDKRGHGGWGYRADGFTGMPKTAKASKRKASSLKPMPDLDTDEETILDHSDDEQFSNSCESPSSRRKVSRRQESQVSSIPSIDDPCTPQKVTQEISSEDTKCDSVPSISSSQTPPPVEINRSSKTKIGEWAKSIQSNLTVTPQKHLDDLEEEEDSTKKNAKFSRDGYATRLRKLIAREKSQQAFWKHKNVFHSMSDEAISRQVRVIRFHAAPSMVIAECTLFPRDSPVTVLFSAPLWQTLGISIGSTVSVHPPWQVLHLSEGREVMLCTNQCVMKGSSSVKDAVTQCYDAAVWDCPCASGMMRVSLCPAYNITVNQIGFKSEMATELPAGSPLGSSKLSAFRSSIPDHFSDSILKSIELSGEESTISFQAMVVKVFCRPQNSQASLLKCVSSTTSPSWSVLLCDAHNFLCEFILPPNQALKPSWQSIKMEAGHKFRFYGIQKLSRIPREKDLALFSVIDAISLSGSFSTQSTASSSSQNSMRYVRAPMSFTYSLQPKPGLSGVQFIVEEDEILIENQFYELDSIPKNDRPTRCNFFACVIFIKTDADKTVTDLYISDSTLVGMRLKVEGAWIPKDLLNSSKRMTFKFVDVLYQKEIYSLDGYSRMYNVPCIISSDLTQIPEIPPIAREKQLVLISGTICDVDEAGSYSWNECNYCQSENLIEKLQGNFTELFCTKCDKLVEDPITRISMEVIVKVKGYKDTCQIKLVQKTSERLLLNSTKDDMGYESTCLIGKYLHKLCCMVINTSPVVLHESELLE